MCRRVNPHLVIIPQPQSNLRKLTDNVHSGSVKKLKKLLDSPIDPNFVTEDGSESLDSV